MSATTPFADASTITHTFGEKIDCTNCDALARQCEKYFFMPAVNNVVFDFENVRVCDSYGLKFLINFQRKAAENHKRLVLIRLDAIIKEMMSLTRLTQFFTIAEA